MNTFRFDNEDYDYVIYGAERTIEAPIGKRFVNRYNNVLEVGNVLRYFYSDLNHKVLDKYEKYPYVINEDIVDYKPDELFDAIICISTLEHIGDGWAGEPKNRPEAIKAYNIMKGLLKPNGVLLCTWPIGYNIDLDNWVKDGILYFQKILGMKRVSIDNKWIEVDNDTLFNCKWETPFICGNGVIFAYYINGG